MTIRAVVFDIGGVLEFAGPMDFEGEWEPRLGLVSGSMDAAMADVWAAGAIGTVTEAEVHAAMRDRLGLTDSQVSAVMEDMWQRYLGSPNTELISYARDLRSRVRTGILSNSFVGAREREEAAYGLVSLVDECVYSHEVGLSKPDPSLWKLTCSRLDVSPAEVLFVDDFAANIAGARAYGMRAVLFESTAQVIGEIEAALGGE
ncbi:putative hydrolase of the HAD superfamily [Asanoa hainanensis]|uniref:Putative hydrolase of the HAD superfamily n=1 Tax=Asanoa hainanensis TaxID=560556 RepID=A0A239PAY6_9ACTN|nr:HAD family phosphatase [Asanoa hainanensis]SNT63579.1 putative hydrolase of the HAD superfamily [Asanoa hainanensis]